jgi:exodeoxyribonuclease VII large subunit
MDVSEQQSSAATIGSAIFAVPREGVPPAAYSVSEVIDIAAEAVKLTFPEEIWIQGEVANYRPAGSNRHCYFDLAERQNAENGRKWDAAVTAIIWKQRWPSLSAKLRAAGVEIQNGQEMLFRARVRLFDGGGKLSLHITDVFPEFTLGRIEQERRAILARLEGEGLLGINQRLSLPPVPLN